MSTPRSAIVADNNQEQEKELVKKESRILNFDFSVFPDAVINQNADKQAFGMDKLTNEMKKDHRFEGNLDAELLEAISYKKEKPAKQIKTRSKRSSSVTESKNTESMNEISLFKQNNKQTDKQKAPTKLKKSASADNANEKSNKQFSYK